MDIEIICTGDEILTGKTINTNFSHISRKLEEVGLKVVWGTTVGDDAGTLLEAFQQASRRARVVIVNGGLGPTVDDLSQEIAAKAAGVPLVMNETWLKRIEEMFARYGLVMQANNRKQALLPETAELIDNPIGTACGFTLKIGEAQFYFTPGVPKELHLMLREEIVPRILQLLGMRAAVRVKRFHLFGLGESHADSLLEGLEALDPENAVKLGFQTHYPQLEAKLSLRGTDAEELAARLQPLEAELRRRLGNFIVAEDDETLEAIIAAALAGQGGRLAVAETLTGGLIASRMAQAPGGAAVFQHGLVAPDAERLSAVLGVSEAQIGAALAADCAVALLRQTGASHALVTLAEEGEGGPILWYGIATASGSVVRRAHVRLISQDWLVTGAVEMGLDTLRRFLRGLELEEKIDFEK